MIAIGIDICICVGGGGELFGKTCIAEPIQLREEEQYQRTMSNVIIYTYHDIFCILFSKFITYLASHDPQELGLVMISKQIAQLNSCGKEETTFGCVDDDDADDDVDD